MRSILGHYSAAGRDWRCAPARMPDKACCINSRPAIPVAAPRIGRRGDDAASSASPVMPAIKRVVGVQRSHAAGGDGTVLGPGPCNADT